MPDKDRKIDARFGTYPDQDQVAYKRGVQLVEGVARDVYGFEWSSSEAGSDRQPFDSGSVAVVLDVDDLSVDGNDKARQLA